MKRWIDEAIDGVPNAGATAVRRTRKPGGQGQNDINGS